MQNAPQEWKNFDLRFEQACIKYLGVCTILLDKRGAFQVDHFKQLETFTTGSTTNLFVGNVRKVQNSEEKNRNHQKKEENLASCLYMPLNSFPTTDGECTRLIFLNILGSTGIL